MVFTMLCLKKFLLKLACAAWLFALVFQAEAQTNSAEITALRANKLDKDIALSAEVKFNLPSVIEEAMYKGVSLTFVAEAEIVKDRWYWTDKTVVTNTRQIRISYQALTRRWRVLPWTELNSSAGLGVQLPQMYDTLAEALGAAQRIRNWRVVEALTVSEGSHWVTMRYRLDISQLPKPLQIGVFGVGEWSIQATLKQRLMLQDDK
jgi:hypothetical protein